jgi:3-hydroxyacyl-CoA dehydrogenase
MTQSARSDPDEVMRLVAVIGAGSIGMAWAIVFAEGGCRVRLQDVSQDRLAAAARDAEARLEELAAAGLLSEDPAVVLARISPATDAAEAVEGADYIQECVPERLDLKREVFATLDAVAPPDAVIASSSSFIPISGIAGKLAGRGRMLIAHPGNPPFLLRIVELVPAPFTDEAAVARVRQLLARCRMATVHVRREVEGFVFNRLQGALLREAYCLVRDGVVSAGEIDALVRDGLGLRWAVIGPFETVDLNTRGGIVAHAERMGPAYERMGAERGQRDPWTSDLVGRVAAERRAALPLEDWAGRVAWRDRMLMALLAERRRAGGV